MKWVLTHPDRCPPGVELIVDGIHVSQSFVQLIKETIDNKIMLVTDALGPAGLNNGLFKLGTLPVCLEDNAFYLADKNGAIIMKEVKLPDGEIEKVKALAGSAASLSHCMHTYSSWTKQLNHNNDEKHIDSLYKAIIKNPRVSSLSKHAIEKLPDDNNYIVIDNEGTLMLSMCHGVLNQHQPMKSVNHLLAQHSLLANTNENENSVAVSKLNCHANFK